MKVALWAENLAVPIESLSDWLKLVDAQAGGAKAQGAELLLMPEYSACHWFWLMPRGLPGPEQLKRLAAFAPAAVAGVSALAKQHDILIVSGSFPADRPDLSPPLTNRAHVHFPDGRLLTQEKLCLTPFEKDPDDWDLSPGNALNVFEWQGYRMAVVICLDIELPALAARLAALKLDLILVPSMTVTQAGYHRVFGCAKARAVELFTAVAAVGVIAGTEGCEQFFSGASVFLPCEEALGQNGILAEIAPAYTAEGLGPLLVTDVPLQKIRKLRAAAAEVWPGAWSAEHIAVKET